MLLRGYLASEPPKTAKMIPRGRQSERPIIALSIVIIILVAALLLVFVSESGESKAVTVVSTSTSTRTLTSLTTASPSFDIVGMVDAAFDQHLVIFTSRNVSAIVSEYQPNANVTWDGLYCLSGLYSNSTTIALLLSVIFGDTTRFSGFQAISISNVTQPPVKTVVTDGSAEVNSTFGILFRNSIGNVTATVSAQDAYTYSTASARWLISQENWQFQVLNRITPFDIIGCSA